MGVIKFKGVPDVNFEFPNVANVKKPFDWIMKVGFSYPNVPAPVNASTFFQSDVIRLPFHRAVLKKLASNFFQYSPPLLSLYSHQITLVAGGSAGPFYDLADFNPAPALIAPSPGGNALNGSSYIVIPRNTAGIAGGPFSEDVPPMAFNQRGLSYGVQMSGGSAGIGSNVNFELWLTFSIEG